MIVILEYGGGNVASVRNALERLEQKCVLSRDPAVLAQAQGIVLPGQGRADQAIKDLARSGALRTLRSLRVPFLGICVGMHLLAKAAAEAGAAETLGIIEDSHCHRLPLGQRVPHMGWNRVHLAQPSPLTEGIESGSYFYFAHSYYMAYEGPALVGSANYGISVPSIVQQDNYYGIQFHPEKSAGLGSLLLQNFCKLCS